LGARSIHFLQRNGKRTLVLSDLESIAAASKLTLMNS